MAKRMRLPNGFGQISKVTGKRLRSPYRAMVTVGKDEDTGKYHSSKAEYLFRGYSYHHFYTNMIAFCERLHLNPAHRPHDTRKTFVTKCKKYNVDEYAIKRMVGHRTGDLTEDVYTERNVEWLRSELNKMV